MERDHHGQDHLQEDQEDQEDHHQEDDEDEEPCAACNAVMGWKTNRICRGCCLTPLFPPEKFEDLRELAAAYTLTTIRQRCKNICKKYPAKNRQEQEIGKLLARAREKKAVKDKKLADEEKAKITKEKQLEEKIQMLVKTLEDKDAEILQHRATISYFISGRNAPGTSHGGNNLQMGQNYGPLPTGMPHQNSGNYSHNSTGLGMFENNAMAQPTASNYGYGTLPSDIAGANTGTVGNYATAQHQYTAGNLLIGAGENNNTGHQPTSLGVAVAEQAGNSSRGMPTGPGGLPMGLANTGMVGNYATAQHQYTAGNLLIGAGGNNTGHQPTSLGVAVAEQGGNSSRGMPTGPGGLPMGLAGSQNQPNTDGLPMGLAGLQNQPNTDGLPMGLAGSQNQPNTDGGYFEDYINQLY